MENQDFHSLNTQIYICKNIYPLTQLGGKTAQLVANMSRLCVCVCKRQKQLR